MAVLIPTGFAEVTLNWTHLDSSKEWATVLGCEQGIETPENVGETYELAWNSNLMSVTDNTLELTSIDVRVGPSSGAAPGLTVNYPVGAVGTNPMSGAPANCTVLVKKLTNLGGRANRGRNYWPGMVADGQVDEVGTLDPAVVIGLQSAFVDFFGDVASGNGATTSPCPMVILHDEASPTTEPTTISAVQVMSIIATQRRRIR